MAFRYMNQVGDLYITLHSPSENAQITFKRAQSLKGDMRDI